jgi:hypothetical protein
VNGTIPPTPSGSRPPIVGATGTTGAPGVVPPVVVATGAMGGVPPVVVATGAMGGVPPVVVATGAMGGVLPLAVATAGAGATPEFDDMFHSGRREGLVQTGTRRRLN